MRRHPATKWFLATAAAFLLAGTANAQVCGNSVVEAGEECDPPEAEDCANFADDDGDGLVDCQDSDCLAEEVGAMFVCGPGCTAAPVCAPLLDDPAKVKFRASRLDKLFLYGRAAPQKELDILNNAIGFMIGNHLGIAYSSPWIWGYEMALNRKGDVFTYKQKATGLQAVRLLKIRKFRNYATGLFEYYFKIKADADLVLLDPLAAGQSHTEEELSMMYSQFVVGDAPLYINAQWERKRYGWYLSDATMSTWY